MINKVNGVRGVHKTLKKKNLCIASVLIVLTIGSVSIARGENVPDLLKSVSRIEREIDQQTIPDSANGKQVNLRSSIMDEKRAMDLKNLSLRLDTLFTRIEHLYNSSALTDSQVVELSIALALMGMELTPEGSAPIASVNDEFTTSSNSAGTLSSENLPAQSSIGRELKVSGFVDALGSYQSNNADQTDFGIGQAEIDLETVLSDRAGISASVARNNLTGSFDLAVAELTMGTYSSDKGLLRSLEVTVGEFDVPFGIDYLVYASIDRQMITSPWFVDVHGGWRGWNDLGLRLSAEFNGGNFVTYWVNGFEESADVTQRIVNLTTGVVSDTVVRLNTSPADAIGARLGLTPLSSLELGYSYAIGLNQSGQDEMMLAGMDFEYSLSRLYLKGEYIYHSVNRSVAKEGHRGYYLHSTYNFNRWFLSGRYSAFRPYGQETIEQFSLGGGLTVTGEVQLRFQTDFNEGSGNNATTMQLVTGF